MSMSAARLSRATAGRFSLYLRYLEELVQAEAATVSSGALGQALGVSEAQVRRDLAHLGHLGYPGIGYYPGELVTVLRRVLGLDRSWPTILVGVGNLGRALLRYQGFRQKGFQLVAVFDAEPNLIGHRIEGLEVQPLSRLAQEVKDRQVSLGVIAVPGEAAQEVANGMVKAGIRGILNFAPVLLRIPEGVTLVSVDLTIQLEQLAFLVQQGQAGTGPGDQAAS
jgi:redox-sensing transcriptional repressor